MLKRGEFWYPDAEEHLHQGHACLYTLEKDILPRLPELNYCVQAGGAVGAWPLTYAKHFKHVYSFEPNPTLFDCFTRNMAERKVDNVTLTFAGLWKESGGYADMVVPQYEETNMGAWHIGLTDNARNAPIFALDDLDLPGCDLLQLDIEGAEIEALQGAEFLIYAYNPVIVVEVKRQTLRAFDHTVEELWEHLERLGYRKTHKFKRDELWTRR